MSNRHSVILAGIAFLCAMGTWIIFTGKPNVNEEIRSKSSDFAATVAAKSWDGIQFSNMNSGAILKVSGTSSDALPVYLLAGTKDGFARGEGEALVGVLSENSFEFTVTIPADGDYLLLLNNRDGPAAVDYRIDATASLGSD